MNWDELFNGLDVNSAVNVLNEKFLYACNMHAPVKMRHQKITGNSFPWISNDLKKEEKIREKLYQKFIREKTAENKKFYTIQRNKVSRLKAKLKQSYFYRKINNTERSDGKWKIVNSMLGKCTKKSNTAGKPSVSDFGKYFSTIASELQSKLKPSHTQYNKFLENRNPHSFFFTQLKKMR